MSRILSIIVGAYLGVVLAQNYDLPKAPVPRELMEKVSNWLKNLDSSGRDR